MFQGLLRAHKEYHDTKNAMTRLWVHECFRVFSDRLVGSKDHNSFISLLSEKLGILFDLTYHNLCPNKQPPIFGDFLKPDQPVYEDIVKFPELKKFMEEKLEDYNMEPGIIPMGLVLFRDAIEHGVCLRERERERECVYYLYFFLSLCFLHTHSLSYCACDPSASWEHVACWCGWEWPAEPQSTGSLHLGILCLPDRGDASLPPPRVQGGS